MKEALKNIGVRYGIRTEYSDRTVSTNDAARDPRYGHGDMIVAEMQTEGRGQRGNSWESAAGRNLTFSIVLHPHFLPAGMQFLLSEAVSLSITDMLEDYGIDAAIKWPNDIYAGRRKIAGILIENDIKGTALSRSIVGIGLNVNQAAFGGNLPNPTSMYLLQGREFDRGEVIGKLYDSLHRRFSSLAEGETAALEQDYRQRLYGLDKPLVYKLPCGDRFTGIIRNVEPTGELIVEREDGSFKSFLFKEIEFVL